MQKINLIPAIVFEIKILQSDWPRAFLYLTREPDFSQIMVHDINPKNLDINGLFFAKSKKLYLWGVFGHYLQNEIFSRNSSSVSFYP